MAVPIDFEGDAAWLAQKHRLQDAFDIGKQQLAFQRTAGGINYNDQLAKMKMEYGQAQPGFRGNLAERGILGSGFGKQAVAKQNTNYQSSLDTLAKNYLLQNSGLNQQESASARQYYSGLIDAAQMHAARQQMLQQNFGA